MNSAILALEDGTVFEGRSFGAPAERSGEVVFNTALTGYQEVFTDPSYSGQIVILTNPQIGNYGTSAAITKPPSPTSKDSSSANFPRIASNWRSDEEASDFLAQSRHPCHLRSRYPRPGSPSPNARRHARRPLFIRRNRAAKLVEKARAKSPPWPVSISPAASPRPNSYEWTQPVEPCSPSDLIGAPPKRRYHVVAYDFGIKRNILRRLVHVGCRVTVVPALTSAEDVLALKPDGVFLSNGPGDPEPLETQVGKHPQTHRQEARSSASASAINCSASPAAARPTS